MTDKRIDAILRRYESLKGAMVNWHSHYDWIARYFIPKKDNVYGGDAPGEEKHNYLYDSTTVHANELLASALHSMLTNPALKWFSLGTGEKEIDKQADVREWFQDTVEKMHDVLNNSNFQTEIHEVYLDLASFGTAPLYIMDDPQKVVRFLSRPIYQLYTDENEQGMIDAVFREYEFTTRQLIQEFGEEVIPPEIVEKANSSQEKYKVLHATFPRKDMFMDKTIQEGSLKRAKYASFHILMKYKSLLRESGFRELRYVVPRWSKISGEKLGRSPAMKALPDARMLNVMIKTLIRGAQKVVDPPLQVSDDGQYRPLKMVPGAINYVRPGSDGIRAIETKARPDIGQLVLDDVRERIRQAFFIDQLQLREGPQMTATEVRQRTEEQLRLLGPILGRLHNELLKPLIDTLFEIMLRRNQFKQVPDVLADRELKITYLSAIARVQRTAEAQNLLLALEDISPIVQNDMSILDNIDSDKAFKHAAHLRGVPEAILRKDKDVEAIRQQRAEMQQQQMQKEQQMQEAEIASKF